MAYVSSMTYTTEAQFLEAIEQVKAARATREAAAQTAASQSQPSFQDLLASSLSGNAVSSTVSSAQWDTASLEPYFQEAADTYNLSAELLKAVARQESGFQPNIVSSAGAIGIMQLMPSTAEYLGVSNPYDPRENIMGGAKLLSYLSTRYNGNLPLTLAAYNAGEAAVDKYGSVPPYQETQNFVTKIMTSLGLL